ncbi:hypothetical protein AB0B39_06630 [Micromonospora sp. NPDC049114]|uniref:hypothetical protein n=1 Tax=unclassified Micromonospora TaxID=2617518 RepID=UPI0033C9564B
MSATSADNWPGPGVQRNEKNGVFIGRDNYGPIHNIDDATREVLKKLADEAPALHEILRRAIKEGLVSPDVVYALEFAARSINEDVAVMLNRASHNINEDNATTFMAAANKLEQLASHDYGDGLNGVAQRVESLVQRFETVSSSLDNRDLENLPGNLDNVLTNFRYEADRIEGVVTPPPAQIVVNWRVTWRAYLVGIATGLALVLVGYIAYRTNR